jgi:hypothetical protein
MDFLKRFTGRELTVEHIEDFYAYAEVSRHSGTCYRSENEFWMGINIESTYENEKRIYYGIMLYSSKNWAHVSVENGALKYQYTENGNLRGVDDCPVTQNEKEIALIAKALLRWYKELGLPKAIEDVARRIKEQPKIFVVNEIEIDGFDDEFPPVLRVFSDKTTSLIFGIFPPRNTKITKSEANNFERLIADATGKKVIRDDRETFVIFDDSQEMIEHVVSFMKAYSD